jgi:hypothetical protein
MVREQIHGGLEALTRSIGKTGRGLPPVERWNPPFCGDLDMRIGADGTWFYGGTPIGRPALVRLFASVLKVEDGRHFLVTPVEKVGITVDDAPFQAVEMAVEGEGDRRMLHFRTNVDDLAEAGVAGSLRFEVGAHGGIKPYVHVRRGLWARVTRALTYDLLALGEERRLDDGAWFGVAAGGLFHKVCRPDDLGADELGADDLGADA